MRLFGGSDEERFETIVSQGAVIRGDVTAKGPVRVDGRVEGDVRSEDGIVVGKDGDIRGNVTGKSVTIGGRVSGRVEAAERVELLGTAQLKGEVWSPKLSMEEGANFDGQVKMVPSASPKPADEASPAPRAHSGKRQPRTAPDAS